MEQVYDDMCAFTARSTLQVGDRKFALLYNFGNYSGGRLQFYCGESQGGGSTFSPYMVMQLALLRDAHIMVLFYVKARFHSW